MEFSDKYLSNEDIICISTSDWEVPYGSRQQIMSSLAHDNRILYVESQISILHILKNPIEGSKRIRRWLAGISRKGNLYFYTPMPLLPFGNYLILVNRINQAILLSILKRLAKKVGFNNPILWLYCVNSALLLGKLNEKLSIFYCLDDFSSEITIEKRRRTLYSLEDYMLKKANIVFACTKALFEERQKRRPDINFLRNGVDFAAFNKKFDSKQPPQDIKNIISPRIGFIGTLDSRIDIDLLFFLASKKINWHIVLIGRNLLCLKDKFAFKKHPNIHALGFRKHELLPEYINMMDVCIIPYRTNGFNRYIFPLKTFEYLAAGKPVVATYLPELEELKDVVKLSKDKIEFMDNIEFFIRNNNRTSIGQRIAAEASWDSKVKKISEIIYQKIERKVPESVN